MYDYSARWKYDWGFTTVDPLAEKKPWLTPYHYCSNNPINRIDPDGMYDIKELEKGEQNNIVIVINDNTDIADKQDLAAAKDANIPVMRVKDMQDFSDAMDQLSLDGTTVCAYSINSHGSPGSFSIGSTKVNSKTDFTPLKKGFDGKSIFIYACNVTAGGDVNGIQLIENLSTQTNSIVVSSDHTVSAGYKFNGTDRLSRDEYGANIAPIAPKMNDFHIATPGQAATPIFNFAIKSDGFFTWETIDKYK